MNLLLVSPHFYPENFKCNDLAFELAKRGHKVTVLSDIPNYPQGKYYKGYNLLKKRKEKLNGVTIYRAIVIPRGNASGLRLALNYASFVLFGSITALYLSVSKKFDAVIVHETSPVTVGIPALVVKKLLHIPMLFWVLDLWPESLTAAGGINNSKIIGVFTRITRFLYKNSNKILISSKGFEKSILDKGDFGNKIEYYPNWVDKALQSIPSDFLLPALPNGFIVMFAGNIGEAQDFEHVMKCALLLRENKSIHFVLVGDGRKKNWVDSYIKDNALHETVHCVGRYPLETMPAFFAKADLMLVSLKDQSIFNLTAPAKIQAYMSAAKPIVMMLNGEGPRIIEEAGCGKSVAAGDSEGLAVLIKSMSMFPKSELDMMGKRGRDYCKLHFNLDKSIDKICDWLDEEVR